MDWLVDPSEALSGFEGLSSSIAREGTMGVRLALPVSIATQLRDATGQASPVVEAPVVFAPSTEQFRVSVTGPRASSRTGGKSREIPWADSPNSEAQIYPSQGFSLGISSRRNLADFVLPQDNGNASPACCWAAAGADKIQVQIDAIGPYPIDLASVSPAPGLATIVRTGALDDTPLVTPCLHPAITWSRSWFAGLASAEQLAGSPSLAKLQLISLSVECESPALAGPAVGLALTGASLALQPLPSSTTPAKTEAMSGVPDAFLAVYASSTVVSVVPRLGAMARVALLHRSG